MQAMTSSEHATTNSHAALAAERERLRLRLKLLHGTPASREIQKYRKQLNKYDAAEARGVGFHYYSGPNGYLREATDVVELLHKWLDDRGVDPLIV